jgi:hypothetical protein
MTCPSGCATIRRYEQGKPPPHTHMFAHRLGGVGGWVAVAVGSGVPKAERGGVLCGHKKTKKPAKYDQPKPVHSDKNVRAGRPPTQRLDL